MKERLATLISGGGTTMQEIIKACQSGEVPMDIACVIVSTPAAGGIEKANRLGIPRERIILINPDNFRGDDGRVDEEGFGQMLLRALRKYDTTIVGQYGWLPKTPGVVIDAYPDIMINQHRGPLDPPRPDFGGKGMYGRRVHAARLLFVRTTRRAFWTEATSQRVAHEFDKGVVLRRERVEILPDDDPISLAQRVLPVEHRVQIETLKDFASGDVRQQTRDEPLIRDDEEVVLFEAKKAAKILFPHG